MSQLMNQSAVAEGTSGEMAETRSAWHPLRYQRELFLAFVLVLASHLFVATFAKIAHWELEITGSNRLASAQLERCKDGNPFPLDEACQFDCCWYSSIIRSGYDKVPVFGSGDRANWSFFPVFPAFASPLYRIFGAESTHAAVLAGKFALYLAILAFLFMVRSRSEGFRDAVLAGTLVAFNPAIIYAHGGYAEPLYFALAATGLALLDRQRWIEAGLLGSFLSATRMVGVVFSIAYAIAALRTGAVRVALKERTLGVLIGALLCPAGLSLYMLYIYRHTGDALAFTHIYVGWGLSSGNPLFVIWEGLRAGEWPRVWSCLAIAGWAVSAWLVVQRQYEKAAFLALAILLPSTA
jgi:hypothetical protein